jgi:hypothetical protein
MSGNGYKALGFVVWRGGTWYLKRRYGMAKRVGRGVLAGAVLAGVAIAVAQRRRGGSNS